MSWMMRTGGITIPISDFEVPSHNESITNINLSIPTLLLMFFPLLPQNVPSWTTYCRLLESYLSLLLMVTLWWSPLSDVFTVSYLTSTSLLVFPFYFSFSDTYPIFLYTVLHLLSLLATNNFILPTLSFSTFLYVLLLVHYDTFAFFISSTTLTISLFFPLAFFIFLYLFYYFYFRFFYF